MSSSLEECGNQTQVLPPPLPALPHREKLSHPPLAVYVWVKLLPLCTPVSLSDGANTGTCPGRTPAYAGALQRERGTAYLSLGDQRGLCLPCHFKRCLCPSLIRTMCWQAEMSTLRGWCPPPPSLPRWLLCGCGGKEPEVTTAYSTLRKSLGSSPDAPLLQTPRAQETGVWATTAFEKQKTSRPMAKMRRLQGCQMPPGTQSRQGACLRWRFPLSKPRCS